jgi:hypothetical protein
MTPNVNAPMTRRWAPLAPVALLTLLLAGCSTPKEPPKIETIIVPIPENIPPEAPPLPVLEPIPPELVTASRAEDLWHLRSALNVAALICDAKVHSDLIPAYNRMLKTHKALLTAAVQTELDQFKKQDGKKWQAMYDTHMTKLYNSYSLTRQRDRFCTRSAEIAAKAADLTDVALSNEATAMIFRVNLAGEIQ